MAESWRAGELLGAADGVRYGELLLTGCSLATFYVLIHFVIVCMHCSLSKLQVPFCDTGGSVVYGGASSSHYLV